MYIYPITFGILIGSLATFALFVVLAALSARKR